MSLQREMSSHFDYQHHAHQDLSSLDVKVTYAIYAQTLSWSFLYVTNLHLVLLC